MHAIINYLNYVFMKIAMQLFQE